MSAGRFTLTPGADNDEEVIQGAKIGWLEVCHVLDLDLKPPLRRFLGDADRVVDELVPPLLLPFPETCRQRRPGPGSHGAVGDMNKGERHIAHCGISGGPVNGDS